MNSDLLRDVFCANSANGLHSMTMNRVLGYMEQARGHCENCGLLVKVHNARWVHEMYLIHEEDHIEDLL